ncbi:hypothetical protein [Methanorbis rubei]|uniref:hypothetical protein n=1 Tax=Methanorbis rubei TaxID=3028300 RepID=UPI0030B87BAB
MHKTGMPLVCSVLSILSLPRMLPGDDVLVELFMQVISKKLSVDRDALKKIAFVSDDFWPNDFSIFFGEENFI